MQTVAKDQLFLDENYQVEKFVFDQQVANCFDDMAKRSIPFYQEIHRIIGEIALKLPLSPDAPIYDLGCSTGSTIEVLASQLLAANIDQTSFIGVDNSPEMIKKCQEKLSKTIPDQQLELACSDLTKYPFDRPSHLIIMNYTLQFIPKSERVALLSKIYQALLPGGVLILSEKILGINEQTEKIFTTLYYDFKRRNGYTEREIERKKEALEQSLHPMSAKEQHQLLCESGFTQYDTMFQWYNFASFIGIK
jgi:tRNA (cmo5U34)-methyltransferase